MITVTDSGAKRLVAFERKNEELVLLRTEAFLRKKKSSNCYTAQLTSNDSYYIKNVLQLHKWVITNKKCNIFYDVLSRAGTVQSVQ